jgi:hypothetical protein
MNKRTVAIAGVSLIALFFAAYAAMRSSAVTATDAPVAISTTPAAPALTPAPVKEAAVPAESLKAIPRIDATTLHDRMTRGEVVVIDVRDIDSYTASHIAGAMHIPLSRIEGEIPYLKGSKPIVTYCT